MTLLPSEDVEADIKLGAVVSGVETTEKVPSTTCGRAVVALETTNFAGMLGELFSLAKSKRCCSCSLSSIQNVTVLRPASAAFCKAFVTSKLA